MQRRAEQNGEREMKLERARVVEVDDGCEVDRVLPRPRGSTAIAHAMSAQAKAAARAKERDADKPAEGAQAAAVPTLPVVFTEQHPFNAGAHTR
eukprot:2278815-Pleurochrysis_carterae.AAC.9